MNEICLLVKRSIKELLDDKLENFHLVDGGMQRTIGDLIESKISKLLMEFNSELITEKKTARSKKSIEDITLLINGISFYVDPKTHNLNSDFSMPNLTSVEKVKKLFFNNSEELVYIFVSYCIQESYVIIENIQVFCIWELDVSILGIGALGKGQLQIKDANKEIIFTNKTKEEWFSDFRSLVQNYLEKQKNKINKQILEWN